MKKALFVILSFVLVVPLFSGQPTTTRARESGVGGDRYRVTKHTFTSTTSLDSIIILNKNNNAPDTDGLEANRTIFTLQFNTAEGTASNSDFTVLWQVSAIADAVATTLTAVAATRADWVTVETDVNTDLLSWVVTFDAAAYKGQKVRAILAEADSGSDSAVAIEAYFTYPRK